MENSFIVETWGDFACFSRPELSVERMSYPVMTPSAARGLLDAIYSKPVEFHWAIDRIEVLRPIRYIALRRNEMKDVVSISTVKNAMKTGEIETMMADADKNYWGTDMKGRTQRQTMALKDVRYRIHAHIQTAPNKHNRLAGIVEQANRRISQGKCFQQPCFGMREFAAYFEPYDPQHHVDRPIPIDMDLNVMLYDAFDLDDWMDDEYWKTTAWELTAKPFISVFRASLKQGVLEVPPYQSELILRPERGKSNVKRT